MNVRHGGGVSLMAKKHTSLYIDEALLADAQRLLGTRGVTETVERALREAADAVARREAASLENAMTEDELRAMREAQRRFGVDPTC
ncbi:MAG: type II toxin-antitoxin system VapB family antitoxin [Gaiellales bacterium]